MTKEDITELLYAKLFYECINRCADSIKKDDKRMDEIYKSFFGEIRESFISDCRQ